MLVLAYCPMAIVPQGGRDVKRFSTFFPQLCPQFAEMLLSARRTRLAREARRGRGRQQLKLGSGGLATSAKLQNKAVLCCRASRGGGSAIAPLLSSPCGWRFLPARHKTGILYSCAAHTPRLCLCPCRGSLRGGSLAGFPTFSSWCASHAPRARTTAQAAPSLRPPSACFGL